MKPSSNFLLLLIALNLFSSHATSDDDDSSIPSSTSIVFGSMGGSIYAFDVYSLPIPDHRSSPISDEIRLTDGLSINYNGHFPSSPSSSFISLSSDRIPFLELIYVTERNGTSHIYLDVLYHHAPERSVGESSVLEAGIDSWGRVQVPLVGGRMASGIVSMKDRPTLVGDCLVYVSTHEDPGVPRASWAAVYSTRLTTGATTRLTPFGVADFSPAVSPSGELTAVASYGEKGWDGSEKEFHTDIYVFLTRDGSNRVKVVDHGGWPAWSEESTLYFHRLSGDGWWSIYRAKLPEAGRLGVDPAVIERVTPPGLHAFTPAASPSNKRLIAVATRRPGSQYRHVEIYDIVTEEFRQLTKAKSPNANHFNPFFSPNSSRVGYHKCRGANNGPLFLETIQNPRPDISLFRINASFPSFSPTGDRIAYVNFPGLYVVNLDGSGKRMVLSDEVFGTAWDPKRKGVVYGSLGPDFASDETRVDIIAVDVDEDEPKYKRLTIGGKNNAFPWPSSDGKWLVFRSTRSGYKNLYIMDAINGETGGLIRLTDGPWTDTMCTWSPDGEWIAFASNRDNPGMNSFAIYMIHPNGTGLRKLFQSGSGGLANHIYFSPDGKSVTFTSDYAAASAEPISHPHNFQPYGEIFTMRLDGSDLRRLTHNSFEDGTPAWGPKSMRPVDVKWPDGGNGCAFSDHPWLYIDTTKHFCAFHKSASSSFATSRRQCSL